MDDIHDYYESFDDEIEDQEEDDGLFQGRDAMDILKEWKIDAINREEDRAHRQKPGSLAVDQFTQGIISHFVRLAIEKGEIVGQYVKNQLELSCIAWTKEVASYAYALYDDLLQLQIDFDGKEVLV